MIKGDFQAVDKELLLWWHRNRSKGDGPPDKIYSVLIGKRGQASHSRPSTSFPEIHALAIFQNLPPPQTARKIIIHSGSFSTCPIQLSSPSLSS